MKVLLLVSPRALLFILTALFFSLEEAHSFSPFLTTDNRPTRKQLLKSELAVTASTSETTATTSTASANPRATVTFIAGTAPSQYGLTSPEPNPTWSQVATQLALRLPHFAQTVDDKATTNEIDSNNGIVTQAVEVDQLTPLDLQTSDIVVLLGVASQAEEAKVCDVLDTTDNNKLQAVLCDPSCSSVLQERQFAGTYKVSNAWEPVIAQLAPWSKLASHQRLLQKTQTLLARKSSEDYLFAILFALHALVTPIDVVTSDINPSWEKGILRNAQEFKTMVDCCAPQIQAALGDPQSKQAIDQLNAVDLRDQVGSYRVIVSNETPQLEDFTLCILQQNNCFQCDAPILTQPQVPLLEQWQGKPLDRRAAQQILMGHLDHPEAADCVTNKKPWSWKIVVGANPAYDAFPLQHQLFYPSGKKGALWYDPVFCVETLQEELVWCKRHYRCTPRPHYSGRTEGAWTLTTLDNGMVSEEHWTTVDAADDLSWAVLHYSGAARRAGQSYVGALLCTADGQWPVNARSGPELDRIRTAFRHCDLELWELFGGSTEESYMWSPKFTDWAKLNPPPLEPIGDVSITTWRKRERAKEVQQQALQQQR